MVVEEERSQGFEIEVVGSFDFLLETNNKDGCVENLRCGRRDFEQKIIEINISVASVFHL